MANNLALDLAAVGEHERARQLNEDTLTRKCRRSATTTPTP
jgi:hypothetical protein